MLCGTAMQPFPTGAHAAMWCLTIVVQGAAISVAMAVVAWTVDIVANVVAVCVIRS